MYTTTNTEIEREKKMFNQHQQHHDDNKIIAHTQNKRPFPFMPELHDVTFIIIVIISMQVHNTHIAIIKKATLLNPHVGINRYFSILF